MRTGGLKGHTLLLEKYVSGTDLHFCKHLGKYLSLICVFTEVGRTSPAFSIIGLTFSLAMQPVSE